MKKIIWIASYPKSGNTWLRSIIASLIYTAKGKFNFNLLKLIEQFDKKNKYDLLKKNNFKYSDIKAELYIKDIAKIWIEAQKKIINTSSLNPLYNIFKTHSANIAIDSNNFTSSEVTNGAIYIVRDPREIVISFAKHRGANIDETIEFMSDPTSYFPPTALNEIVFLSNWKINYESWQKSNFPLLLIKYEDLILNSQKEINKIENFLKKKLMIKIDNVNEKTDNIIESTNIENLKNEEKKFGFDEASPNSNFFRMGKINNWKNLLNNKQISKIENTFKKTMINLDYL